MSTFFRVDPNQSLPPQLFVIDSDNSIIVLQSRTSGPCQGTLQTLHNPAKQGSQDFTCTSGATISTDIYRTNP